MCMMKSRDGEFEFVCDANEGVKVTTIESSVMKQEQNETVTSFRNSEY
jgi:hypothetical protein